MVKEGENMVRFMICILLLCVTFTSSNAKANNRNFVVGNFGLHFDKLGDIIKPDEYYFFEAKENTEKGFRESAHKNFIKAASYGNTFGAYYTGLMYLQDGDQIKGHAWLKIADSENFAFANKVTMLLLKLEHQMSDGHLSAAKDYFDNLNQVYGVEPTLKRRLKWSRNFVITGTRVKGKMPSFTKIRTDPNSRGSNVFINAKSVPQQLNSFVYEYKMDARLVGGEVRVGDLKLNKD